MTRGFLVRLIGIEPTLSAPEADALSTELQARALCLAAHYILSYFASEVNAFWQYIF